MDFGEWPILWMDNWSAHTDKQHKVAASRRVLRAGGLQR